MDILTSDLMDVLTNSLTDVLTNSIIDLLTYCLMDVLTSALMDILTNSLTDELTNSLMDVRINSLMDVLTNYLTDVLTNSFMDILTGQVLVLADVGMAPGIVAPVRYPLIPSDPNQTVGTVVQLGLPELTLPVSVAVLDVAGDLVLGEAGVVLQDLLLLCRRCNQKDDRSSGRETLTHRLDRPLVVHLVLD